MEGYTKTSNGKALIRRWSGMNPEMDYIVIVDETEAEKTEEIIDKATDAWWDDDEGLGYTECFEIELEASDIKYECIAYQDFLESKGIPFEDADTVGEDIDEEWEMYIRDLLGAKTD